VAASTLTGAEGPPTVGAVGAVESSVIVGRNLAGDSLPAASVDVTVN
jgi:hypothetical protein